MILRCSLAVAFLTAAPAAAWAADALHPYSNIDHRVDAGNDTGDSQVDALNQAQLDGATAGGSRWVPGVAHLYPGRRAPLVAGGPYGAAPPYPAYPAPHPAYAWPAPAYPGWW